MIWAVRADNLCGGAPLLLLICRPLKINAPPLLTWHSSPSINIKTSKGNAAEAEAEQRQNKCFFL
jgi:hypothetical protein